MNDVSGGRREAGIGGTGPGAGGTLFLLNSLGVGGSEKKTVAIANALALRGHGVHVAYLQAPETLRSGIDSTVPIIPLHRSGRYSPAAVRRLHHCVRSNGIGHIIVVNLHPLLYAFPVTRLLRSPVRMTALVNTTDQRNRRDALFMKLYAPLLRSACRVVFGSQAQEEAWVKTYRLPPERCRTIYNGVDTTYFLPPESGGVGETGASPGRFVIGTVGAFRSEKAQEDLLRAAGALCRRGISVSVLLVGDGPRASFLQGVAENEGLSGSVTFQGVTDDVRPLLARMDVFVLSSVAVETFSNAALEAMAMSRCVVLSDIGGAREMIVDGESGFIYPPGDVPQLTEVLARLHREKSVRDRVARAARKRAEKHFSFQRMLDEYVSHVLADRRHSDRTVETAG